MKKRLCFSSVFLFLCWASLAQGIEAIPVAEIWDLNKCVTMALAHHPDLKSAQGKVYVADSRIGQVKSKLKPQVDIATGYTRQDSSSTRDREIYSSSAEASQLISDGGKTDVEIE
ncbi:TolC family protein, partial [Aminobacterium sp. UBA5277]